MTADGVQSSLTNRFNIFVLPWLAVFVIACESEESPGPGVTETIESVATRLDARIGVAIVDTQSGREFMHAAHERFPLTSTFKTLACAALLYEVDAGRVALDAVVTFSAGDLVSYSPVTEQHVGAPGMTMEALCTATMTTSDNSAANFILHSTGGPPGLNQFLRLLGDDVTRLDRSEPELNEAVPGDERDTTTPAAMVKLLRQFVLGDVLSPASRQRLQTWLKGNEVSDELLRAGVPADWVIGDRSGAGGYGSRSITAVMWPPGRAPVIAAVYLTGTDASMDERNSAIADIGRAIAATILD